MVDLLMLLNLLVNLRFVVQADAGPEQVPFVLVSLLEPLALQDLFKDFGVSVNELEVGWIRIDVTLAMEEVELCKALLRVLLDYVLNLVV